jgi:hypothetical protein
MRREMHTIRSEGELNYLRTVIDRLQREGMREPDIEAVIRQVSTDPGLRPKPVWQRLAPLLGRARS